MALFSLDTSSVSKNVYEKLPTFATLLLKPAPDGVKHGAIEFTFNRLFKSAITDGELEFMREKSVAIEVNDVPLVFAVTLSKRKLLVSPVTGREHAAIKIDFNDILLLAQGEIDPDTLFFRRRLKMSGDTEVGLALKNFLDTVNVKETLEHSLPAVVQRVFQKTRSLSLGRY